MHARRPIIFLHLTKTGGITLRSIIKRQLPQNARWYSIKAGTDKSIERFKQLSQRERDGIAFLSGHMPFGLHEFFSSPSDYVTLLRNPVDVVLSGYFYALYRPTHGFHASAQRMTLREYVTSGLNAVVNHQTRLISGGFGMRHVAAGVLSPDALKVAKEHLQQFSVVGITERFDETLLITKKKFRFGSVYYRRKQETKMRPHTSDIPQDVLDLIRSNNKLDMELWSFAGQILDEEIRAYGSLFKLDLTLFKNINHLYQAVGAMKEAAQSSFAKFLPAVVKRGIRRVIER